ncbi:unnamed protein product [Colias eurytheme]|nr:unnamed protein product [Colias eurytheme]
MENLSENPCEDGECFCLSPRSSVALISIIGLVGCLLEILSNDDADVCVVCYDTRAHVDSFRSVLVTAFQMANMLLLLGSIVENAMLLQIYLWYSLAFIVMGFVVSILGFLFRLQEEGAWSLVAFIPEIVFLFVMYQCLPLVDHYRKRIDVYTYDDS